MAAREVGGLQVQNQGTVGGNVCNASPAADGTAALMALDASVELLSAEGRRELALSAFVTGPRRTALRADELVSAVLVPLRGEAARSVFLKLGHRRYLVISIAMVGARIALDADGRIGHAAVAVGACSAVAARLPALEARVRGLAPSQLAARCDALVDAEALAPLAPIADVRGSAGYRREAAAQLVVRALAELAAALPGTAGEAR
jgi:CO/xanthine dehydrogenase FAD-binding subunit